MGQRQPFDPQYPTSPFVPRPPAPPRPPQEDSQIKRILWVQSRQMPVEAGLPDQNLMSIPAATSVDVFISYTQPGQLQTIKSPDGRETFRMYVNEQLTLRQAAEFTPGGVPDFVLGVMNGNSLPVAGRVFALRDFPADGWELKIDTSKVVFIPKPIPTDLDIEPVALFLNVTCIGWAREPTGIGPFELQTSVTGDEKTDLLVTGIFENGLTSPVVNPAAFDTFTRTQLVDFAPYWDPGLAKGKAGASNVLLGVTDTSRSDVPGPVFGPAIRVLSANKSGAVKAEPAPILTAFTESLTGEFDMPSLLSRPDGGFDSTQMATYVGLSGRIDASAPPGVYYVQLWARTATMGVPVPNATAVVRNNGAIGAPIKISHGAAADDYFQVDLSQGGFQTRFNYTLCVTLSTTEFVKSASPGNFMSVTAMFRPWSPLEIDELTGLPE